MTSIVAPSGVAVDLPGRPRRRPVKLTPDQVRAHRNEDWRIDHEVGRIDPVTGMLSRRPIALIAILAGASERTVRHGIAEAKRLREDVRRVAR